ncbi:4Fe-4S dicluster domain-containing protein [Blattabacterium cuenoti]|uniref:4Fe-4S dicluster domain-containing protein n=1 Tax=Blattabacterium cuenoti TaxID=1653831 RepID=UPI00163B9BC0|nr:4Fe-4S dicluster domain-containing protein [Blattabacterium cuenoti]
MSIKITTNCINCGACEPECPNNAIYEGGKKWKMADGTTLTNKKLSINLDPTISQNPKNEDIYFIVSEKCTECIGFFSEPQCVIICPVNCCVKDLKNIETKEDLLKKKKFLHG